MILTFCVGGGTKWGRLKEADGENEFCFAPTEFANHQNGCIWVTSSQ